MFGETRRGVLSVSLHVRPEGVCVCVCSRRLGWGGGGGGTFTPVSPSLAPQEKVGSLLIVLASPPWTKT